METRTPLELYSSAVLASENIRKELKRMRDDVWKERYRVWEKKPRWVRWLFSIEPPVQACIDLGETDFCWAYHELRMNLVTLGRIQDRAAEAAGVSVIEAAPSELNLIRIWTKLNRS